MSDASRVGVQMNLCSWSCSAHGEAVGEHPFRQRLRIEDAVHRRQQDGGDARREAVTPDDVARELVVGAILDDELHLVVRREPVEVVPVVLRGLPARRALDVDDLQHGRPARA